MEGEDLLFCLVYEEIDELRVTDVDFLVFPAYRKEGFFPFLLLLAVYRFFF